MAWAIEYAASVQKTVRKLARQERQRIHAFLEEKLAGMDDPRDVGKALTGSLAGLWRYRVGDYRIVARIEDERLVVLVMRIGHRGDIYR